LTHTATRASFFCFIIYHILHWDDFLFIHFVCVCIFNPMVGRLGFVLLSLFSVFFFRTHYSLFGYQGCWYLVCFCFFCFFYSGQVFFSLFMSTPLLDTFFIVIFPHFFSLHGGSSMVVFSFYFFFFLLLYLGITTSTWRSHRLRYTDCFCIRPQDG